MVAGGRALELELELGSVWPAGRPASKQFKLFASERRTRTIKINQWSRR